MNLEKFNINAISKLYSMQNEDIEKFADCLTQAFKGYSLFEYFANYDYTDEKMKKFWRVMIKANKKNALFLSNDKQIQSVCICFRPKYIGPTIISYIKSGGMAFLKSFGIKGMLKMTNFENYANNVKKSHADDNCWYIYTLATLPNKQKQGQASNVLKAVLQFMDDNKQNCYLETLNPVNIEIYQKFGFDLVEDVNVPNTPLNVYAMLRQYKHKKTPKISK